MGQTLPACLSAGLFPFGLAEAYAQDPEDRDTVVITGSLIKKGQPTASPVVTVTADELKNRATLTLETALNRLPQITPSYSSASNNPSANGAAYIDLRGLGRGRNLVLLNGRRVIGANASNSVDVNTIPSALVERVDVLTGGGAAVYGADAIAGAVNIVLRDDFDGVEAEARTLVSDQGDGRERLLSLTAGLKLPSGNLAGHVARSERHEIGKGARPFSSQAAVGSTFFPAGAYSPGPNLPSQAAVDQVFASYGVRAGAVTTRGGFAGFGFNPDGTLFGTGLAGNSAIDAQNVRTGGSEITRALYPDIYAYNFEPFNKLVLPLDRTSAAALGKYDLSERVSAYGRAFWTNYTAATALAPTPAPTDPNPLYPGQQVVAFTIPVTNPFIPADLRTLLDSRRGDSPALAGSGPNEEFLYRFRTSELGGRQSTNDAEMLQFQAGLAFERDSGWRYEIDFGWGEYTRDEVQAGLLSVRRFEQLLDSPTGGADLCAGGLNPFGAGINPACRDFLSTSARFRTKIELGTAQATVTPPPIALPAGDLETIGGIERRVVTYSFAPPTGIVGAEVAGFIPQGALRGDIATTDLFAEAATPLAAAGSAWGRWDATLGYRASIEDGGDTAHSAKAEASWSPHPSLMLRSSLQRAIRAPDIFERFQPTTPGIASLVDPCSASSPNRTAQMLALCRTQAAALGFTASFADTFAPPFPDTRIINSGTRNLEAETADTLTIGAVWRPSGGDRLLEPSLSVDWYKISIDNAITYADPQSVVSGCYGAGGVNAALDPANPACRTFIRSAVDFALSDVASPRVNQALVETSGVDISGSLRADIGSLSGQGWLGELRTRALASRLEYFTEQNSPQQPRIDYAGTIGGGTSPYKSLPEWRGQFDLEWLTGPWMVGLSARHIGAMQHRLKRVDATSMATGVGAATYWDLTASLEIESLATVRFGALNLLDRQPELFTPGTDANTDPSVYDVIGRRFWVSITLRS